MQQLLCDCALLPGGWSRDVLLEIGDDGTLTRVEAGGQAGGHAGVLASGSRRVRGAVVPGLPNLHSHSFQRAMAGRAETAREGDTFWTWRNAMYRLAFGLQPDDVRHVTAQLGVELLRHGYTAVGEFHYLHGAGRGADPAEMAGAVLRGARAAGLGMTMLPCAYMRGGFDGRPLEGAQQRFKLDADGARLLADKLRQQSSGDPNVGVGIAAHSLRAIDAGALQALCDGLDEACPIHIHVAEQLREVEDCIAHLGTPPIAWLLDNHAIDQRWCLVHATHAAQDEIWRLATSGACVAICPTTEANLGDGIFPAELFLRHGGQYGIGSDSQVCVDPAEELRLLEYGQRLQTHRRGVLAKSGHFTGAALLRAAWATGEAALGRKIGRLQVGYRADLVALAADTPTLAGLEGDALLDAWVFGPGMTPVRDVMVGGRWMIEDRRHPAEQPIRSAYIDTLRRLHS